MLEVVALTGFCHVAVPKLASATAVDGVAGPELVLTVGTGPVGVTGAEATTVLTAESAPFEPAELVAVTCTRSVKPTSASAAR